MISKLDLLFLCFFHLVFFRKFYFQNPYCYATSEALDTAFPSSHVLGQALRKSQLVEDHCYYPGYTGLPFLSSFYPFHCLQAYCGTFLSIDAKWILFSFTSVIHFLWASIGAYLLFGNLFGVVTLAYMGYNIKQNPSIIYTVSWTPWFLYASKIHNPFLFGFSMAMGTLAGYWPLWVMVVPCGILFWLFS